MTTSNEWHHTSLMRELRALAPSRRPQRLAEARVTARRQADLLLATFAISAPPVPTDLLSHLPRIHIAQSAEQTPSGSSHWNGEQWVISLRAAESPARQRFTLLHELKHIIDHGAPPLQLRRSSAPAEARARELLADYFAGCVLMPAWWLRQAWHAGWQQPELLAERFGVSVAAMNVRLSQVGLIRRDRFGRLLFVERRRGPRLGAQYRRPTYAPVWPTSSTGTARSYVPADESPLDASLTNGAAR